MEDENLTAEEKYNKLAQHHIEETTFLVQKLREIIKKYL